MKLAVVNGYRPPVRYRFFSRYTNGVTFWVRLPRISIALHVFTPHETEGK